MFAEFAKRYGGALMPNAAMNRNAELKLKA